MRICTEAMAPVRGCTHLVMFLLVPQTPRAFRFVRWNLAKRGHARIVVDVMAHLNPHVPFRLLTIDLLKGTSVGFDRTSVRFDRKTDPEKHPTTESSTIGAPRDRQPIKTQDLRDTRGRPKRALQKPRRGGGE